MASLSFDNLKMNQQIKLDSVFWRMFYDIYGQTHDLQLLSKLSINALREHLERVQHLNNTFNWFLEDYLHRNSQLFSNDSWIRTMISLRQYLEKSRILVEIAINQIESNQSMMNEINELTFDCHFAQPDLKLAESLANFKADGFCFENPIRSPTVYSSSSSSVTAVDTNNGQVTSAENPSTKCRPKNPLQIFDENGKLVDLSELSSRSIKSAANQQQKESKPNNNLTTTESSNEEQNWIEKLVKDLNELNIDKKVIEFITISFDHDDNIDEQLKQFAEKIDMSNMEKFRNKIRFMNKLYEYSYVQSKFMFQMYNYYLLACKSDHVNNRSCQINSIIECFGEFFKIARPILSNFNVKKCSNDVDDDRNSTIQELKKLRQTLIDIRKQYSDGHLKLSETNIRLISMIIVLIYELLSFYY